LSLGEVEPEIIAMDGVSSRRTKPVRSSASRWIWSAPGRLPSAGAGPAGWPQIQSRRAGCCSAPNGPARSAPLLVPLP